jgi:regulator of CtrA degradation
MATAAYFSGPYDEAMTLMVEARNYLRFAERGDRQVVGPMAGLRMSCEAMRVTSRLTQVMAWLLAQRAVQEGEISAEQALSEQLRLSGEQVCLDLRFSQDANLPGALRSLADRSYRLYVRVARLERALARRVLH